MRGGISAPVLPVKLAVPQLSPNGQYPTLTHHSHAHNHSAAYNNTNNNAAMQNLSSPSKSARSWTTSARARCRPYLTPETLSKIVSRLVTVVVLGSCAFLAAVYLLNSQPRTLSHMHLQQELRTIPNVNMTRGIDTPVKAVSDAAESGMTTTHAEMASGDTTTTEVVSASTKYN
jgi:hypothetical protein